MSPAAQKAPSPISPPSLAEIRDIFDRALAMPEEERSAFIKSACRGQVHVEEEVRSLLNAHNEAPEFLAESAATDVKKALKHKAQRLTEQSFTVRPKVIGKYTLLRRMGIGGMAEIFHGMVAGHGGFEKQVAVKSLLPSLTSEAALRELFENEARINSVLTHSNIAQVYDFFQMGDNYFLSMEYVDGKNLRQIVEKLPDQIVPLRLACYVISEVAKGLAYAHSQKNRGQGPSFGIIHRDISPKNIMCSYDGEVKIVDFGIAKARERAAHTHSMTLKGTFKYMSPEQALVQAVDHRSDIFSTGLVLYELLTGGPLFKGQELLETLEEVRKYVGLDRSAMGDRIPDELFAILEKALARDVEARYSSAEELHRALHVFLTQGSSDSSYVEIGSWMKSLFQTEIEEERAEVARALALLSSDLPVSESSINISDITQSPTSLPADASEPPSLPTGSAKGNSKENPFSNPEKFSPLYNWDPSQSGSRKIRQENGKESGDASSLTWALGFSGLVVVLGFGFNAFWSYYRSRPVEVPPAPVEIEMPTIVSVPPVVEALEPVATPEVVAPTLAPKPPEPVVKARPPSPKVSSKVSLAVQRPLELTAPANGHEFTESDDFPGVTFSWRGRFATADDKEFIHRLEISRDSGFTTLVAKLETAKTSINDRRLKLTAGNYFWRVLLVNRAGKVMERTAPFRFSFRSEPPMLAPRSNVKVKVP